MGTEFRKLWLGQAVSAVGSSVTQIALPLTAALTLSATSQQMGMLSAAGSLPILLFAVFAGAWADRLPRRPVLIVTDLARAAILVTIPIAALAGRLTIEHVLVASFAAGSMTVLFQAAYLPYVPVLVERSSLVAANSRLALNGSVARVVGPSLGGLLVQLVTGPIAILLDAASFVVSAAAVGLIRARESVPPKGARRSIWAEIGEGLQTVRRNPFIRSVTTIALIFNFAIVMADAVYILYATRVLGLDAALLGLVFTVSGLASVLGATLVHRTTARFGIGRSMSGAVFLIALAWSAVLAAAGPPAVAAIYLAIRGVLTGFGAAVFNVTSSAVGQAAIPDRLQGRVGGVGAVLGLGLAPIAALGGGWLGDHIGLWNTIAVSLAGQLLGLLYVVRSPLWKIRTTDDVVPMPTAATPS